MVVHPEVAQGVVHLIDGEVEATRDVPSDGALVAVGRGDPQVVRAEEFERGHIERAVALVTRLGVDGLSPAELLLGRLDLVPIGVTMAAATTAAAVVSTPPGGVAAPIVVVVVLVTALASTRPGAPARPLAVLSLRIRMILTHDVLNVPEEGPALFIGSSSSW